MDKIANEELRELEQYFFSENVLNAMVETFQYETNILCLCTPSVADAFWCSKNKEVFCLDLDDRFSYLPKYIKYDVSNPKKIDDNFAPDIIIVDPPFFKMSLLSLYNCIELLTAGNKKTKIVFCYVIREEKSLLNIFKEYQLKLTKFPLEYKAVDKSKWSNYGIYTNFENGRFKFSKTNNTQKH